MTSAIPRVRSALFVPAHRSDFLGKVERRGTDAVILDLEDAVPHDQKDLGRSVSGEWIASRPGPLRPVITVRINALDQGCLAEDLAAVVHANLTAIVIPKVRRADEVRLVAEAIAYEEGRKGVPYGSVRIWPIVETAAAVRDAYEIATASARVAFMGGGTGRDGDLARDLGYRWSVQGAETAYLRSKVLIDVRAAGVPNPLSGLVAIVDETSAEAVRLYAEQARDLGYEGVMVIHPDHVAIVNEVFTPTEAELREARAVIEALAEGERVGRGAITIDGRMIDAPNGDAAHRLLAEAERIAAVSGRPLDGASA